MRCHFIRAATVAKRTASQERAINRKTIAQGRPDDPATPVVFLLCILSATWRTGGRGCQSAPGLPCALFIQEGHAHQLGRDPPRDCGGVSRLFDSMNQNDRKNASSPMMMRANLWLDHKTAMAIANA